MEGDPCRRVQPQRSSKPSLAIACCLQRKPTPLSFVRDCSAWPAIGCGRPSKRMTQRHQPIALRGAGGFSPHAARRERAREHADDAWRRHRGGLPRCSRAIVLLSVVVDCPGRWAHAPCRVQYQHPLLVRDPALWTWAQLGRCCSRESLRHQLTKHDDFGRVVVVIIVVGEQHRLVVVG
jgi:hypothetical protein